MSAQPGVLVSVQPNNSLTDLIRLLPGVLKLRIGATIAFAALAGLAVTPGPALAGWQVAVLALCVLLSSAAAGGFNQYLERDSDARMARTRGRPFVTGALTAHRGWLVFLGVLLAVSVAVSAWALNPYAALHIFLGAFVYMIVYTVWLKRRTWLNIVIGGLAGSFAVLAGAAAVDPEIGPRAAMLALVLFLWTPSHFWSLAIARHDDYARAGIPMLPVEIGDCAAARAVLLNTVTLVAASVLPVFFGLGWIYLLAALASGAYLIVKNIQMTYDPTPRVAMASFLASLVQISVVLTGAIVDVWLLA